MPKLDTIDSAESGREQVDNFLQNHLRASENRKLKQIKDRAVSEGPMSPDCRVAIMIPAHFAEKNLGKTLLKFLEQTAMEDQNASFEINVLVNGPDGVDLPSSPAYQQVLEVKGRFPELTINLCHANFQKSELTIGLLRKQLAAFTLDRAASVEGVDVENLVLVTQDADLQGINEDYVKGVDETFQNNPELGALTGFVDYPQEDFHQDHLFLAVQRFNDILEMINRHKLNVRIFRAGNSCFRAKDYMESGGHSRNRKRAENTPIYRDIKKKKGQNGVGFDRHLIHLTTSARRQIMAMSEGLTLAQRYDTFGEPGDLAEKYQVPSSELMIPETVHKVTSPDFAGLLQLELQAIYTKGVEGAPETGEKEANIALMRDYMQRAGFFLGIKIDFEGDKVVLQDMSKLKELILKKYSHF